MGANAAVAIRRWAVTPLMGRLPATGARYANFGRLAQEASKSPGRLLPLRSAPTGILVACGERLLQLSDRRRPRPGWLPGARADFGAVLTEGGWPKRARVLGAARAAVGRRMDQTRRHRQMMGLAAGRTVVAFPSPG